MRAGRLFRKVLCAVDLTDHSGAALYNSVALAQPDGHLTVVSVAPAAPPPAEADTDAHASHLRSYVQQRVPNTCTYIPDITCEAVTGDPATEILSTVTRREEEVLVMGMRGRGALLRGVLGSVVRTVLQHSEKPVMVVPFQTEIVSLEADRPVFHLGRIMVPLDPYCSRNVNQLALAAHFRRQTTREPLVLLYVQSPGSPSATDADLHELARRHNMPDATTVRVVRAGSIPNAIVEVSRQEGAGLIVMGLERGGKRMAPGSIAYEVLCHSQAVVLAVPPQGA